MSVASEDDDSLEIIGAEDNSMMVVVPQKNGYKLSMIGKEIARRFLHSKSLLIVLNFIESTKILSFQKISKSFYKRVVPEYCEYSFSERRYDLFSFSVDRFLVSLENKSQDEYF